MGFIAKPFGYVMQFCASLCMNNYALALLLFALIVKLVLLPFGIKQQSTQIKTAKLRPKVAAIEKKYAGRTDRVTLQKKQTEIMELQQREGVSLFGGCLPLLIQFPILLGLYEVVRKPLTYLLHISNENLGKIMEKIDFGGKAVDQIANGKTYASIGSGVNQLDLVHAIKESSADLSGLIEVSDIPDFSIFGIDILNSPSSALGWLLLIPLFAGVTSYFTMWLTRRLSGTAQMMGGTDAQKSNLIMDLIMPLISAYMSYIFPATLGLYWAYQSIFGIGQTLILSKVMPLPKFTAEDMKRAEKEMKVEEAKRKPTKVRSLHHIDDDEEDEAVARASGSSSRYGDDEDDTPAAPVNQKIAPATMKTYDRPQKKNKKADHKPTEEVTEVQPEQTDTKEE